MTEKSRGTYYNENEPFAADWLRNLIRDGHIPAGEVDQRDIQDVRPDDLRGFAQHHFFAGLGGWARALRLAEWPDDRRVWTASCPCQPFSQAGKRAGASDERHLWPSLFHLLRVLRPRVLFGEQVASRDGITWLDLVSTDLEGEGYACGPIVLPACSVGAPHIRQRIFFLAYAEREWGRARWPSEAGDGGEEIESHRLRADGAVADSPRERCAVDDAHVLARGSLEAASEAPRSGETRDVGNTVGEGREGIHGAPAHPPQGSDAPGAGEARIVGDAGLDGTREHAGKLSRDETEHEVRTEERDHASLPPGAAGATKGFWSPTDWLPCLDGKWRPVEPGTFPLAVRVSARVGRLRAYGNAISPPLAEKVIRAGWEFLSTLEVSR